uniref:adseverin-like n=2 Tax=Styela clava TaxID=7725 RepID=UPI00193AA223|nr:adseverin-like [Styela clava]XP_039270421.1 adseverin-like [Styela clava]
MTAVFETAGKKEGLQIWRVENFKLVENSEAIHGNFYVGDSYLLLKTIKTRNGKLRWDLHFWLGSESSQDERGAAAILTCQMDEYMGGDPVQYRQLQGYESSEFMAMFNTGVKYMQGGVESGFKQVKTNVSESKRLLHVKGRRSVRATEVPMKWSSFNHGDSFILDYENNVYQWNGKECNHFEKLKANNVARAIISYEKGGKGKLIKIEDGERIPTNMLQALLGTPGDILPSVPDDVVLSTDTSPAVLYHVCADTGKLIITEIGYAPLEQDQLDSGDSYILDNGSQGKIFVWKGKGASREERLGALEYANKFIERKNYTESTGIEIMAEGAETILFKQFFSSWRNKDETVGFGKIYAANKIAKIEQIKFDMKSLNDSKLAAKYRMVDDGSGKLEIWRVEDGFQSVDPSMYGVFYDNHCYIMLYTYKPSRREEYIIYFWQGRQAPIQKVTVSSFLAVELCRKYRDRPVQVRVIQGKEPPHLLSLFGGKPMIIVSGNEKISNFISGIDDVAFLQIFCTATGGRAIQVSTSAGSLNSNDAFVLKTRSSCYIWVGLGASNDEIDGAKFVADKLCIHTPVVRKEGKESPGFWYWLGGKQEYANHPRLHEDLNENPPRLFGISDASGRLVVDEVPGDFTQADLCEDDVMMLDVWDQIFIWIGNGANSQERKEAPKLAEDYIKSDPRKRDARTSIITITQGNEPLSFTGFLPTWDPKFVYSKTL